VVSDGINSVSRVLNITLTEPPSSGGGGGSMPLWWLLLMVGTVYWRYTGNRANRT
jgi:hypothetical protein